MLNGRKSQQRKGTMLVPYQRKQSEGSEVRGIGEKPPEASGAKELRESNSQKIQNIYKISKLLSLVTLLACISCDSFWDLACSFEQRPCSCGPAPVAVCKFTTAAVSTTAVNTSGCRASPVRAQLGGIFQLPSRVSAALRRLLKETNKHVVHFSAATRSVPEAALQHIKTRSV